MDDSRKSSESESYDSTTSDPSSDVDQLPAKKPFLSYRNPDEPASNVCSSLGIESSEGTTVLRRSLRKIIEESKRDAASSSVSNSRESTPPRISGSGRRLSSRRAFLPSSGSRPASLSKNSSVSAGLTRAAVHPDFHRRSARMRRMKRVVDDGSVTSLPVGTDAVSSDDDGSIVKDLSKVCDSGSSLNMMTMNSRSTSLVDTSDTDSRASSLYAYGTRSAPSRQISTVKLNSRSGASAQQKTDKRSRMFAHSREKPSKMQSSDSETGSQMNVLQTSFFDSFPDNLSSGSSIASSVRNADVSTDRYIDNRKHDVDSSLEAKEKPVVKLDLDEALKKSAELDTDGEKHRQSELKVKSSPVASKKSAPADVPETESGSEKKDARIENEFGETDESSDGASDIFMQKDPLSGDNRSAALAGEDNVVETKEEAKDASLKINCNNVEAADEDVKMRESLEINREAWVADHAEDEEAKADGLSKPASDEGNEDQDVSEKFEEDADEMLNVKEEPPEILVNLMYLL